MLIQESKVFRDSVHGYISIPVDYVVNFVDTDIFQRLRYIEQTGMRTLYPSARHDRFIHSLGTYFLGRKAFESFKNNIQISYHNVEGKTDHYKVFDDERKNEAFWDKCRVLFEIACLLHDCGHAPFSHTMESHYDVELRGRADLKAKLKEYIGSRNFQNDFKGQGSPHERMSALMVCSEFKTNIEALCEKYGLDDVDIGSPTEFIARMIIGCEYTKRNPANQIMNCLISLLNSKSIDVDSLDYIIRDAKLSGVDNMSIDVDRLLGSLTLIETTEFTNHCFRDREIYTDVIKGTLTQIPGQRVQNAKIDGNCRGQIRINDDVSGGMEGFVDVDGSFKTKNTVPVKITNETKGYILINGASQSGTVPALEDYASVRIRGGLENRLNVEGNKLSFGEQTNCQLSLSARRFDLESTYIGGKVNGAFSGELLGDFTEIGGAMKCTLGYHKSSLSVIQNVVLARNYEYQWIYSHHKVVYYSNYLLIDLFRNCVNYILNKSTDGSTPPDEEADEAIARVLSWDTMITHSDVDKPYHYATIGNYRFFRPIDADLNTLFKNCQLDYLESGNDDLLSRQLNEFYTRRYKKSLWKSHAEFNIFFSDFTEDEKKSLFNKLTVNSSYRFRKQYGYLNDEWERRFNEFGLKNVVWVNGDSKMKFLDPDNTYIAFKNAPLTYRTVDSTGSGQPIKELNLFYIYFDYTDPHKHINESELREFFRAQIQ